MRKIAFITDTHLDEELPVSVGVDSKENLNTIIADVLEKGINEIVIGGDLGEPTSHEWFFRKLKSFNYKIIVGNHDTFSQVQKHYNPSPQLDELYYTREDEFLKYIYLDTSSHAISELQLDWFRAQLSTKKKILLFMHHPALSVNTVADKMYPLQNRSTIIDELIKIDSEVTIFCGHYHMEDVQDYKNIKQVITPAASFQLVKDAPDIQLNGDEFGYTIISIEKDVVSWDVVRFEK